MTELQRYDPQQQCPKCGGVAGVTHVRQVQRVSRATGVGPGKLVTEPEHMRRICMECGYRWNELPLDAELDVPPSIAPSREERA